MEPEWEGVEYSVVWVEGGGSRRGVGLNVVQDSDGKRLLDWQSIVSMDVRCTPKKQLTPARAVRPCLSGGNQLNVKC